MTAMPHASNKPGAFELEVTTFYDDILDTYANGQDDFFTACHAYTRDPSLQYDRLQDAATDMGIDLMEAIHRIASQRIEPATGLLHAHGFMIATDALRAEHFNRLVPEGKFVAYRDCVDAQDFGVSLPTKLQHAETAEGAREIIDELALYALELLNHDVSVFAEATVTGYPYGVAA